MTHVEDSLRRLRPEISRTNTSVIGASGLPIAAGTGGLSYDVKRMQPVSRSTSSAIAYASKRSTMRRVNVPEVSSLGSRPAAGVAPDGPRRRPLRRSAPAKVPLNVEAAAVPKR